jgi:hypothetical protein
MVVDYLNLYNQVQTLKTQWTNLEVQLTGYGEAKAAVDTSQANVDFYGRAFLYYLQVQLNTGAASYYYNLLQQEQQKLTQLQAALAAYTPIQSQLAQVQAELVAAESAQASSLNALIATSTKVPTLQSRNLATANPALNNTFNTNRTRAQLEAMNVFSETAMRIVGDVYKNDVAASDLKLKAASDKLKAAAPGSAEEATTKAELATAQAERNVLDNKRAVAHGLVGGLTAALGGADPVSGTIGATAGKYVTTELSKLIDDSQWALENPYAANLLKTLSATAAGSLVGGDTGGFLAGQGDRFNRQLHWSKYEQLKASCGQKTSTLECRVLQGMAGVTNVPQPDLDLATDKVVANYNAQGQIVSYTLLDKSSNQPWFIMQPLEFAAYQSNPAALKSYYARADQLTLDFNSAGLYSLSGYSERAREHLTYVVSDPSYQVGAALTLLPGVARVAGFVRDVGALGSAVFAQRTYSKTFSAGGKFAGQTIDDVADALRSGALKPSDVPIEYIVRDGNTLILNTRSAQALQQAGIPRMEWNSINMTGNAAAEARLTGQLQRNGLTSQGIAVVVPKGR